jgi:hypothetical protein
MAERKEIKDQECEEATEINKMKDLKRQRKGRK